MLSTLVEPIKKEGKRPRFDRARRLLHECIIGHQDGEEDPQQSGNVQARESEEIKKLSQENRADPPPVAKSQRGHYVWVAKAASVDGRDMYTMDPGQMKQMSNYAQSDQNVCDICGQSATEVLYEFRCYRRRAPSEPPTTEARAFEPFISYISKTCGEGLLGVRSEASKFREMVFRFVQGLDGAAPEALQAFWQTANPAVRGMLLSELGIMAGVESGDRRASVQQELKQLETQTDWGPLHKMAEDPFRALGRALNPALSARDLALVAVMDAKEKKVDFKNGSYLAQVKQCLEEKRPVPAPPAPWKDEDVIDTVKALVEAWRMRITLFSSLRGMQEFVSEATLKDDAKLVEEHKKKAAKAAPKAAGRGRPKKGAAAQAAPPPQEPPPAAPTLRLAYATGVRALHGPQVQRLEPWQQQRLKEKSAELLSRAKAEYGTVTGTGSGSGRGPTSKEDEGIKVPEKVELEDVRHALESVITWPQCTSRANVRPAGQISIDAFMLGLIKPYFQGLMCSRRTRMLPNLTRLCARLAYSQKGMGFTSIQLNKDYNARLHVDKNNHGPSWIIGLGDYEGGELWVMDEKNGNYELEIDEHMTGYRHLYGTKQLGRLLNIKNTWVEFDGNLPHKAMAFKGTRISIVYFTRKGWLEMEEATKRKLLEHDFLIPGEDFAKKATGTEQLDGDGNLVQNPRFVNGVEQPRQEDSEDEVDENEEMHFEGSEEPRHSGWAVHVRETLGVSWEEVKPHLGLVACRAGLGPGSVLALKELLPVDDTQVICVAEDKTELGDKEGRLAEEKINVARKSTKAECAFSTLEEFVNGKGHCYVKHGDVVEIPAKEQEQIFLASLQATLVSAQHFTPKASDNRWGKQLRVVRKHLEDRRPPMALIDLEDWQDVHAKHQQRVLEIMLHDREAAGGPLGLCTVQGYAAELLEVRLQDCGLPVAGARAMILLLREDCGGKEQLKAAVGLARLLLSKLPRCTVQDILAEDDDAALKEARAEWLKAGKPQPPIGRQRAYTEKLREEKGNEFVDTAWFPHLDKQRMALNQAFAEAHKSGLDVRSLVVNLGQGVKQKPWRDDGLLPATEGSRSYGPHYSFLRHRPLTGREELLCRGLPVSRLSLKGFSDADLRRMAPATTPPPAAGAALAALLAVADLKLSQGRDLRVPPARLKELLEQASKCSAPAGSLAAEAEAAGRAGETAEGQSAEGSQISSRAVAYLNLLSGLRKSDTTDQDSFSQEDRKKAQELQEAANAARNATAPDELPDPVELQSEAPAPIAAMAPKPNEQKDWLQRAKELEFWYMRRDPVTADTAMRWVLEAAEQERHPQASKIISEGCKYIQLVFEPSGDTGDKKLQQARLLKLQDVFKGSDLAACEQILDPMLHELHEIGIRNGAQQVEAVVREAIFLKRMKEQDPSVMLSAGTGAEWAAHYVQTVVLGLRGVRGRRLWLEHFATRLYNGWNPGDFLAHGGFEAVADLIDNYELLLKDGWQKAEKCLKLIAEKVPGTYYRLYRKLLAAVAPLTKAGQELVRKEVEQAMARIVKDMLKDSQTAEVEEVLSDFLQVEGHLGTRFQATMGVVNATSRIHTNASATSADLKAFAFWKNLRHELDAAMTNRNNAQDAQGLLALHSAVFEDLRKAEDVLTEEAKDRLQRLEYAARKREDNEQRERKEAEVKAKRARQEELRSDLEIKLQDAVQKVRHIVDGCSASADGVVDGNFKRIKDAMEVLVNARNEFETKGGKPDREVKEVAHAANQLALRWCQRPLILQTARRRIEEEGLGCCVDILDANSMLGRLDDVQASPNGYMLLEHLGLPPGAQKRLLEMARAGAFSYEMLRPVTPRGFRQQTYEPHGLDILINEINNDMTYVWEERQAMPREPRMRHDPQLPAGFRLRSKGYAPGERDAPYIFRPEGAGDEDTRVRCMLCKNFPDAPKEHFQAGEHRSRQDHWRRLCEAVLALQTTVMGESAAMSDAGSQQVVRGVLAAVWKEELLQRLQSVRGPPDVTSLFWHLAVLRVWPSPQLPVDAGVGELAAVSEALGGIVECALRQEPSFKALPPKPGKDFICYPAQGATAALTEETPQEEVERFTPQELLGEGIEVRGSGFFCGFCEEELTKENLMKHLHPYFTTGKRHLKYRELSRAAVRQLQAEGWDLGRQCITISNKVFSCSACGKNNGEPWYQVEDHLATNKHRQAVAKLRTPSKVEEEEERSSWGTALDGMVQKHLEGLSAAADAAAAALRAAAPAPPAESSAAGAGTKRAASGAVKQQRGQPRQEVPPSSQASSSDQGSPPRNPEPEQFTMPVPIKDFPWKPRSADGIEERDGKLYCLYCNNNEVRGDKETHVAKKDHQSRAEHFFMTLDELRRQGWRLRREGITLVNNNYSCRHCQKEEYWWNLFNVPTHWNTKGHRKYRAQSDMPNPPDEVPDDDPEKVAWEEMFAALEAGQGPAPREEPPQAAPQLVCQCGLDMAACGACGRGWAQDKRQRTDAVAQQPAAPAPKASREASGSSDAVATPPAKKPRVEEQGNGGEASSSTSTPAAGVRARPPPSARDYRDPPDEGSISAAQKRAADVWCPDLPHSALTWGYFRKPALWVWCKECREWVALVEFNFNTQVARSEDGECPHYDKNAARRFNDAMQDVFKKWSNTNSKSKSKW